MAVLAERGLDYEAIVSEPVGRRTIERYAFMWRPDVVQILGDIRIYPDPDDGFIREPAVADFQAGTFDFTLITIHSIYGDRKAERRAEAELLDEVYAAVGRACCTRSSPNIWRPSCSSRAWPKQQLPGHFEEELRVYLKCGILAHGFVRLRCADCESPRDVTSTGAPLPPPPGPSRLFIRGIEVQTLKCIRGA